eukprot:8555726-Heterocapsa_arctica.AAC.1
MKGTAIPGATKGQDGLRPSRVHISTTTARSPRETATTSPSILGTATQAIKSRQGTPDLAAAPRRHGRPRTAATIAPPFDVHQGQG